MSKNTPKENKYFFLILGVLSIACFLQNFQKNMSTYTGTMFAMNYDFGPMPNAFLGSFLKWLGQLFSFDIYNYEGAYKFSILFTIIFYILLFTFYKICITQAGETHKKNQQYLIMFLSVFALSFFSTSTNFGHFDLYLYIFTLLSMICIIKEKYQWLIIPFGILCMLIRQDFIFSHGVLILVPLLYKILLGTEKNRKKHIILTGLFLLSLIVLYCYFEWICVFDGSAIVDSVKTTAKTFSETGKNYSNILIKDEILQDDMTEYVAEYRIQNAQDFPAFCILFAPYIIFGARFLGKLIMNKSISKSHRLLYVTYVLGGIAFVPLFINGIYYGRYMFQLIFYYIAMLVVFLALQDKPMEQAIEGLRVDLKKISPMTFIWILYPLFLMPMRSVAISNSIHTFAEMLFTK